jgi:hypothetical protein
MPSNSRNRQRRPSRRQRPKPSGRSLLVVCEGTTEKEYIDELAKCIGNPSVQIRFCPERGTPDKIIELAQNECRAQAANRNPGFDEVWCVFDRDDHEHFLGPIQTATDRSYCLAVSNPCIELWLLIHHREAPGQLHRDQIQKMLKRFDAGYKKHVRFDRYRAGIENAVRVAHRMDSDAKAEGSRQFMNPSSTFYRLVSSVATRSSSGEFVEGWEWLARYQ